MDTYLCAAKHPNGGIISRYVVDLESSGEVDEILFLRTPTTGSWMDALLPERDGITRILYHVLPSLMRRRTRHPTPCHPQTVEIEEDALEHVLGALGKSFDLIVLDPFHEYENSRRVLRLVIPLLTERGRAVCHDCFPLTPRMAAPGFMHGRWSGETYLALIDFAFHNPDLFYGVLNVDTGIGIISRTPDPCLTNELDREKQARLLSLCDSAARYAYFRTHSVDLIHAISS